MRTGVSIYRKQYIVKARVAFLVWMMTVMVGVHVFAQSNNKVNNTKSNFKTLVIASHPTPEKSVINKALQKAVQNVEGVTYRNLEAIYGNDFDSIDIEAERKAYEGIDRVVFMYPIQWFNLTPMLKTYFNKVWFQWDPQNLKGKEMLVVVTAGANEKAYSHEGKIGLAIGEILSPMRACANYVGMDYVEPLAFLGVTGSTEDMILSYQKQLVERLKQK